MDNSIDISNDLEVANYIIEKNDLFFYNQSFYKYFTNYWKPIPHSSIRKIILDILKDKYKQNRVSNIIDMIQLNICKTTEEINLNKDNPFLNVLNGHYLLRDKKIIGHSNETKDHYSTNILNINFNKKAGCKRWMMFLNEIFQPDKDKAEKIMLLQEYLGYCLTKNVLFQKALLMLGTGSNGKSIIIQIMERILGTENYSNIELHHFQDKHYVIELQNKLVNFCSEIDPKNKFSSDIFKRIVTGETITGDEKFKNPIKFQPYCKLLFATNELPITNDTTRGYFRRLLILKFNRSFEGKERDDNLITHLYKELDGIFIWILEGLERLYKQRDFTIPESHTLELQNYLESSNSVVSFINERCAIHESSDFYERYDYLFDEYRAHALNSGNRPFSKHSFKNEMEKHFPKIEFSKSGERGRHFKYIELKKPGE